VRPVFRDRADAGRRLAERLAEEALVAPVVFGLPRGGLPVAREIAKVLKAPLGLVLVRKIGAPGQPELALGAVVNGAAPETVWNARLLAGFGLTEADMEPARQAQLAEIARRRAAYGSGDAPEDLSGRTAVLVDDGVATGATMRAAIRALRRRGPAAIVLAVPVAAASTLAALAAEADGAVCLETPADFYAVGAAYRDFTQVEDAEVTAILAEHAAEGGR
jgi:putative phosphoribosyl transferase